MGETALFTAAPTQSPHPPTSCNLGRGWRREAGIGICHSRISFPINPEGESEHKAVWKGQAISLTFPSPNSLSR